MVFSVNLDIFISDLLETRISISVIALLAYVILFLESNLTEAERVQNLMH